MKKLLVSLVLACFVTPTFAAVQTVECSSDAAFGTNACDQCFTSDSVAQGDTVGLLTDEWENNGTSKNIMYKEEQEMPKMLPLNGATWSEVKASDSFDFWTFTEDLEALYSETDAGYLLDAGQKVTWIESTLGSAYKLDTPATPAGNAGMLTYDISVHNIGSDGTPDIEAVDHRECVLIKSTAAATPETPSTPTPETPKELPQTGPEHILLGFIALLLGGGIFYLSRKKLD